MTSLLSSDCDRGLKAIGPRALAQAVVVVLCGVVVLSDFVTSIFMQVELVAASLGRPVAAEIVDYVLS